MVKATAYRVKGMNEEKEVSRYRLLAGGMARWFPVAGGRCRRAVGDGL